jgi:hypothetical protein
MWRRMWPLAHTNFLSQVLSFGEALSLPKAMRWLIALRTRESFRESSTSRHRRQQCEILFRCERSEDCFKARVRPTASPKQSHSRSGQLLNQADDRPQIYKLARCNDGAQPEIASALARAHLFRACERARGGHFTTLFGAPSNAGLRPLGSESDARTHRTPKGLRAKYYFGASEAMILSKRGSPRSGSQRGVSRKWP